MQRIRKSHKSRKSRKSRKIRSRKQIKRRIIKGGLTDEQKKYSTEMCRKDLDECLKTKTPTECFSENAACVKLNTDEEMPDWVNPPSETP